MLYKIQNNTPIEWTGEPINSISYPTNIEYLWSDDALQSIGLYKLQPADPVPDGYIITSSSISIINGQPKVVNNTRLLGPDDYPLTARQLRLGMIRNNVSLTQVQNIINGIPNEKTKDEYQVYWEYSTTVNWSHPITQSLIAAVGLSQSNAAIMWMIAKDYEA